VAPPRIGERARETLDEGLAIFARVSPDDLLRGQALLESGRLALATGDREGARSDLAAAVPILSGKRGPAHAEVHAAKRLLREAGG
jgi:hypothetical protein